MKQHIEAALVVSCGRIESPYGAARPLAINPYMLRGKMRQLEMAWGKLHPGRTT
jgi:hypothetical protein